MPRVLMDRIALRLPWQRSPELRHNRCGFSDTVGLLVHVLKPHPHHLLFSKLHFCTAPYSSYTSMTFSTVLRCYQVLLYPSIHCNLLSAFHTSHEHLQNLSNFLPNPFSDLISKLATPTWYKQQGPFGTTMVAIWNLVPQSFISQCPSLKGWWLLSVGQLTFIYDCRVLQACL